MAVVITGDPNTARITTNTSPDGGVVSSVLTTDGPTSSAMQFALLMELKAIRKVLVDMLCESGRYRPEDYDPDFIQYTNQVGY